MKIALPLHVEIFRTMMKKHLLSLAAVVALGSLSQAQYSEDFEGVTLSSGTGQLPPGWMQFNLDNLTPVSSLSWMGTNAWVVRDASAIGGTKAATSISWYNPTGQSDDWMISPPINVPATNPYLIWKAATPDPNYPDGYQVWIVNSTPVSDPCDTLTLVYPTPCDFTASPSNKIFQTSAAPQTFQYFGADLGNWADSTVYLAWRNNSNDKFILYIDDIQVLSLPNIYDVAIESISLNRFEKAGQNVPISITIKNNLGLPVNSCTVSWSDGTNTYTQNLTGLNIPPLSSYTFSHSTPFNKPVGEYTITVTVSNPNGQPDTDPSNNSLSQKVSTIGTQVTKLVVIEEGTGTWCGWCPRGFTAMEQMHIQYPNTFVGIAVHNSDPMVVTAYDNAMGLTGYPGCNVERHLKDVGVNTSLFQQYYNQYSQIWPPASLTVTPTVSGNNLTVNVKADFVTTCSDEFRLAVVLTEDGVKGNNSSYSQANYYAFGSQSLPYGNINFQSQPDPVPYTVMWYDHTARALLGGFNGQVNSIPASAFVSGGSHTYSFNYTIPAAYNKSKMEAIALLIHSATGRIWNAGKAKISPTTSAEEVAAPAFTATLYPNPAADVVNLSFTLEEPQAVEVNVYDMQGRLLLTKALGTQQGVQNISLPVDVLPEGHYLLSVATPTRSHTQHLTIAR